MDYWRCPETNILCPRPCGCYGISYRPTFGRLSSLSRFNHQHLLLLQLNLLRLGIGSDQCLYFLLIEVGEGRGCRPRSIVPASPLPLSSTSTLSWLGFTHEGTPAYQDSVGIVRLLNRSFAYTWMQVASSQLKRTDFMWVVGLQESPAHIRYIHCRGVPFPYTLPKPVIETTSFQLPYCEMGTEKGKFEVLHFINFFFINFFFFIFIRSFQEDFWRNKILTAHQSYLRSRDYQIDDVIKSEREKDATQKLMLLFAVSCSQIF